MKRNNKIEIWELEKRFYQEKGKANYNRKLKVANSVQNRMAVTASRVPLPSHDKNNRTVFGEKCISLNFQNNTVFLSQNSRQKKALNVNRI